MQNYGYSARQSNGITLSVYKNQEKYLKIGIVICDLVSNFANITIENYWSCIFCKNKFYTLHKTTKKMNIQTRFLERIKELNPANVSFTDTLAEILNISSDSTYRRLRGETELSISEVYKICTHFKVSFDSFIDTEENIVFRYSPLGNLLGFEQYLNSILGDMRMILASSDPKIMYAAIDVPIFHHFNYPALSAFKMFYWMKTVVNAESLSDKKFNIEHINPIFSELGRQIYNVYCQIPSVEIWTAETINSLVKQIEFYWESGNFASKTDALIVCNEAITEIETLDKQAETGFKNSASGEHPAEFALYTSDNEIGNNCILTKKGDFESVYLSVHTFNKITGWNPRFVEDTKYWLNNLIKKSTLISGVSQKYRYQFFKQAKAKLITLYEKIEQD